MRYYSSLEFPVHFLTLRDYEHRASHATDFPNHIGLTNDFSLSHLCLLIQLSSMMKWSRMSLFKCIKSIN